LPHFHPVFDRQPWDYVVSTECSRIVLPNAGIGTLTCDFRLISSRTAPLLHTLSPVPAQGSPITTPGRESVQHAECNEQPSTPTGKRTQNTQATPVGDEFKNAAFLAKLSRFQQTGNVGPRPNTVAPMTTAFYLPPTGVAATTGVPATQSPLPAIHWDHPGALPGSSLIPPSQLAGLTLNKDYVLLAHHANENLVDVISKNGLKSAANLSQRGQLSERKLNPFQVTHGNNHFGADPSYIYIYILGQSYLTGKG
jgi:hypothetical protein